MGHFLFKRQKNNPYRYEYFFESSPSLFPNLKFVLAVVIMTIIAACIYVNVAHAEITYPTNLWKGLIAEDVSGGYKDMYAVACCVRNRLNIGMNTGLVGLNRKDLNQFVKREGVKYELMAKDIIRKVFSENAPDITRGATHYDDIERFGIPKWSKGMVRTVKISCHTFFREKV